MSVPVKRPLETGGEHEDPIVKRRVAAASAADKQRVLHPDYQTPFQSYEDAWQRLLAFHMLAGPHTQQDDVKSKEELVTTGRTYLQRFNKLKDQLQAAKAKAAERPAKEDQLLLEKLSYYEDRFAFDQIKQKFLQAVQQARQQQQQHQQAVQVASSPHLASMYRTTFGNTPQTSPFSTVSPSGVKLPTASPLPINVAKLPEPKPMQMSSLPTGLMNLGTISLTPTSSPAPTTIPVNPGSFSATRQMTTPQPTMMSPHTPLGHSKPTAIAIKGDHMMPLSTNPLSSHAPTSGIPTTIPSTTISTSLPNSLPVTVPKLERTT